MQNKIYLNDLQLHKELTIQGKQIFYNEQQVMSFQRSPLIIQLSNQGEVLHLKDGEILKRLNEINNYRTVISDQNELEIIVNIEQLKHLRWEGQLSKQNHKIGNWTPFWDEKRLEAGGNYNENGQREGLWIDLHENYWEGQQIKYRGEYRSGKKIGKWEIEIESMMSDPKIIGGGQYDENTGEKIGIWKELHEDFDQCCQNILEGEYRFGKKVGNWTIKQLYNDKIIGGGNYVEGDDLKNGKWVEPHYKFSEYCEVKFVGQYNQGKKQGKWEIQFGSEIKKTFKIIGHNIYNQENGQEDGNQTELYENFTNSCQIVHVGKYKNGNKIGFWKTKQLDSNLDIGGGNYDEVTGLKTGQWIEIHENFDKHLPVGYFGQYKNGKKIGKWETKYLDFNTLIQQDQPIIGGGSYDEENGIKIGHWQELYHNFWRGSQVKYMGQYQNGKKCGSWDTLYQGHSNLIKIGGGNYDEITGLKTGKWIELYDHFYRNIPIVFQGNYHNGVREGPFEQQELQII